MDLAFLKKIAELKSKVGILTKDMDNPFFKSKYFDVNQLLENIEPHANALNLLILQPIKGNSVSTIIYDLESENTIESTIEMQLLPDPQKMGSAITYYRRYTLQSLLSLQAEDDDGNKAAGNSKNAPKPQTKDVCWMSEKQFEQAKSDLEKAQKALEYYNGKVKPDGKVYRMKKEYQDQLLKLL